MYQILIAEDEYLLRSELALCEDWNALGFRSPILAENGEQGLQIALAQHPDVILTDIRMPVRDGLSMLGELHAQGIHIPSIVISGYDEFQYAVEAMRCGVIDYLLKPIDQERFHQTLADVVARLQERQEAESIAASQNEPVSNLYLQQATAYMQEHYAEDLHIADVARALYLSDAYLGRLFVRGYRMKFTDSLNRIRIQNAIPLLKNPRWKLYQIAQKCGYRDQQYFSNVFKKTMGVTPYQFRHSMGIHLQEEK